MINKNNKTYNVIKIMELRFLRVAKKIIVQDSAGFRFVYKAPRRLIISIGSREKTSFDIVAVKEIQIRRKDTYYNAISFIVTDHLPYVMIVSVPDAIIHRELERKLFLQKLTVRGKG